MGQLGWAGTVGVFQPFGPPQQTGAHAPGGRGHGVDLAVAGSSLDGQYHRVSGHYPAPGRDGGTATFFTGRAVSKAYQTVKLSLRQAGKIGAEWLDRLTVIVSLKSNFFCQENLTKFRNSVKNRDTCHNLSIMALGKLGTGIGALALGATVAGAPEQAEADNFAEYCTPIASGEILESELTPQNMGYIFDQQGRVIRERVGQLTDYYSSGISEGCDVSGVTAYVLQVGNRVVLEVYPPGRSPLVAPATLEALTATYRNCLAEGLAVIDDNNNGLLDPGEDIEFYQYDQEFCDEELQGAMEHEARMAVLRQRHEAVQKRLAAVNARIRAQTDAIIRGARLQVGLY